MTEREQEAQEAMYGILQDYRSKIYNTFETADAILNLRDSKGNRLLGVIAEDQTPPENPWEDHVHLGIGKYDGLYRERYFEAQQDMLAAGFVKIEGEK